jgi:anaerobic selenocysteine-containing dehydrogenase
MELMMNIKSACSLDCYDACSIILQEGKIKPDSQHELTQNFLCSHLNHFNDYETIQSPRYKGKSINLSEALEILVEKLSSTTPSKTLHYRGSGNVGLMQEVSDHFFASHGATLTDGSLCDGAGQAAITDGRGYNHALAPQEIAKSDVVIVWGRNLHTTHSHLLPYIKDKTVICIDPVKTKTAQMADLHIQLKPRGDFFLALLLSRFAFINDIADENFLEEYASEYDDFYDLTQTIRIKAILEKIDVSLGVIGKVLEIVKEKKVTILIGAGVQKYQDGYDVVRAIDSFGAVLGLHTKEGCGVNFLGDSKQGIKSEHDAIFNTKTKRISKVDTEFSNFDIVFVQGANIVNQMPDTKRVKNELGNVETLVYFGLYENETSAIADLVIPAKNFLQKNDIRLSYSSDDFIKMNILDQDGAINNNTISEYNLTKTLCNALNIKLEDEESYIGKFMELSNNGSKVKNREQPPYKDGFTTDDEEFCFLEEIDIIKEAIEIETEKFYLITPKSAKSLNSQFKKESSIYLNSNVIQSRNFKVNKMIKVLTPSGEAILKLEINNTLRDDCVLIYSGTSGVNNLTSSKISFDGNSAVYQEHTVILVQN